MNDLTPKELEELTQTIKDAKPVAVGLQMTPDGLAFILKNLMIANKERYMKEQGIQLVGRKSVLSKFEARVLYSDSSSKIISIREEK